MIEKKDKSVRLNSQDLTLGGLLARGIPGGTNMTDCLTMEMLSEFIDGKLTHENREKVVAHLNNCELCYSTVSESLGIGEELNKQKRTRINKYLAYSIPTALAAAAVLLVVFRISPPAHEFISAPEREVARQQAPIEKNPRSKKNIELPTRSFAGELADRLAKTNNAAVFTRIAGTQHAPQAAYGFSSFLPLDKTAFRIGVCLADLELALKAKDKEKIKVFVKKLIELLKPMESSYGLIPSIIERDVNSGKETGHYEGFSRAVEALFENKKEAVFLKFGTWVEAAGLAAEARDAAFFQPANVSGFKKELENIGVPAGTMKNLKQLELITAPGGIQADQFKVLARLLADIKEMF